jgi:hypothetical protein
MEQFIRLILALGFKQVQNVGEIIRYMLYIKRNNIKVAYISVFVDEEGRFAGYTDEDTEVYQWELQIWQMNPRKQIMYLPDHFEFSIDTRGRFEESDLFKETVEQSIKFIQDIDKHIKNVSNEMRILRSKKHFMPDPDSDEYQENLEIGWELSDLQDDVDLMRDLRDQQ